MISKKYKKEYVTGSWYLIYQNEKNDKSFDKNTILG